MRNLLISTLSKAMLRLDDRRMQLMLSRLLQTGVVSASVVVLVGGVKYLLEHAGAGPGDLRVFTGGTPMSLREPGLLAHRLMAGDAAALIQLGVVILIATPVLRVVFATIGFVRERDRLYVAIGVFVLGVMMVGLLKSG